MGKKIAGWIVRLVLAAIAVWFFTWILGTFLGLAVLIMIIIHESCHLWAAKKLGVPTHGFILLPIGAAASVELDKVKKRWHHYLIAIAGPLSGLILAGLLLGFLTVIKVPHLASYYELLLKTVWAFAIINLFNLMPLYPLDGGRMLWAIGNSIDSYNYKRWIVYVISALSLIVIFLFTRSLFWFFLLLWFNLIGVKQEAKIDTDREDLTKAGVIKASLIYSGLIAAFVAILLAVI